MFRLGEDRNAVGVLLQDLNRCQLSGLPIGREDLVVAHVERSNVKPVRELVDMLLAQRIFESNQRVLTTQDETLRRAVNELPNARR